MTDENQGSTENENQEAEAQKAAPSFSQEQVDKVVADRLARERKKYDKKYAGVDVDAYNQWQDEKEQTEIEAQKQRGEFDKILKTTVEKKDTEIHSLRSELKKVKINDSLLSSAAQLNAVAPDQVSSLLINQIQLSDEGQVEVVDINGTLRYSDNGEPMKPSDLVTEFLTANPHFVKAGVGGTGSTGNTGGSTQKPKSVAEMTDDEYREYRKSIGRGSAGKSFISH